MRNVFRKLNVKMIMGIMLCVCVLFMNCEMSIYASECEDGGQHVDSDKDCACDKCGKVMHAYRMETYVPTSASGAVMAGDSSNTTFSATNSSDVSSATVTLKQWGNMSTNNTTYGYNLNFFKEGDYVVYVNATADGNVKTNIKVIGSSTNIVNGQTVHFTKGNHSIAVSIDVTSFTKGGKATVTVNICAMKQELCANCGTIKGEGGEEESSTEESSTEEETEEHVDINMDCVCDKCGKLMHVYETKTYVPTSVSGGVVAGSLSNTKFSATNTSDASTATITLNQWGNTTTDNTTYSHSIDVPKEGDYVIIVRPNTSTGSYALTEVVLDGSVVLAKNVSKTQIVHLTQGKHWIETSINVTMFRKGGKAEVYVDIASITETKCKNCGALRE